MVSPIAIAYVTDTWPYEGGGGAEKALLSLIVGLDRRQFRPLVVSVAGDGSSGNFQLAQEAGASTALLPTTLREGRGRSASNFLRLVALLRRHKVRIVHSSQDQGVGVFAGVLAGVGARIHTTHRIGPRINSQPYVVSRAVVAGAATRNIAVSEAVSRDLVDRYRVDPSRVTVIYNGVRRPSTSRVETTADPGTRGQDAPLTVVSVGRLSREKGLDILLDSMALVAAQLNRAQLIVVGDGPERYALERRSAELGISHSVHFVGYHKEISGWLKQATVFAMPSRSEGLGMAAAEALAHGIPVACSNAGGLPEVVKDGCCGTVVAGRVVGETIEVEPRAFANALLGILSRSDGGRDLGRNGRARFDAYFTEEGFVRRHVQTYLEELERIGRRSSNRSA